jgi:hypothetical protein
MKLRSYEREASCRGPLFLLLLKKGTKKGGLHLKKLLIAALTALLLGSVSGCSSDAPRVTSVGGGIGEFEIYKTLDALEQAADTIVQVKYTGNREQHDVKQNDYLLFSLSTSNVNVLKSYKGDLKPKDPIQVFEEGVIKGTQYINTSGYKWMNEKGSYLLFLTHNPQHDGYVIVGGAQGKYDLSLTKRPDQSRDAVAAFADPAVEFMGDERELDRFYNMKKSVVEKYKQ